MNFLELAQRVKQEAGISGVGPTAVTNQVGMFAKIVDWTRDAWLDIQGRANGEWRFMRKQMTVPLTAGQRVYPVASLPAQDIRRFDPSGAYLSLLGLTPIAVMSYEDFRRRNWPVMHGATVANGRPAALTFAYGVLQFDVPPEAGAVASLDYWRKPVSLQAVADIPDLDDDLQMAIVHRAVMFYCGHDESLSLFQDHQAKFTVVMRKMMDLHLPQIELSSCPLA